MWDACLLCFLESPPTSMAVTSCLPVWQEIFHFTVASGERYPSSFLLFLLPAFPFLSASSQSIVGTVIVDSNGDLNKKLLEVRA